MATVSSMKGRVNIPTKKPELFVPKTMKQLINPIA